MLSIKVGCVFEEIIVLRHVILSELGMLFKSESGTDFNELHAVAAKRSYPDHKLGMRVWLCLGDVLHMGTFKLEDLPALVLLVHMESSGRLTFEESL